MLFLKPDVHLPKKSFNESPLKMMKNAFYFILKALFDLKISFSFRSLFALSLALEVFKSITHVNPEFMWSYFNENTIPYNLRNGNRLLLPPAKFVKFGINSLIFRGSL